MVLTEKITFIITVASEIMAILCLADNMKDLEVTFGKNYCCLYL
ncbi:MAG: formate--tetrahydrofolate ligase [Eubacterium sp.]